MHKLIILQISNYIRLRFDLVQLFSSFWGLPEMLCQASVEFSRARRCDAPAQPILVCLGCWAYPMSCVSSAAEPNPPKNRNVGSNAGQIAVWDCSGMVLCFESAQVTRMRHCCACPCDGPEAVSRPAVLSHHRSRQPLKIGEMAH